MKSKQTGQIIYVALFTLTLSGVLGAFALSLFKTSLTSTTNNYHATVAMNAAISANEYNLHKLFPHNSANYSCATVPSSVTFKTGNLSGCSIASTCQENATTDQKMFSLVSTSNCTFNEFNISKTVKVNTKVEM